MRWLDFHLRQTGPSLFLSGRVIIQNLLSIGPRIRSFYHETIFALVDYRLRAFVSRLAADEPATQPSADETAIRDSVKTYVDAFNKHDAKALADMWSPDAVYLNRITGEEVVGAMPSPRSSRRCSRTRRTSR